VNVEGAYELIFGFGRQFFADCPAAKHFFWKGFRTAKIPYRDGVNRTLFNYFDPTCILAVGKFVGVYPEYGKLNSDGSAGAFIGSISSYAGSFVGPEEEPSLKAGYSNEQSSKTVKTMRTPTRPRFTAGWELTMSVKHPPAPAASTDAIDRPRTSDVSGTKSTGRCRPRYAEDRLARAMRQTNDTTFLEQVPLIAVAKRRSQLRLD
jgi:hypothetical protein